MTRKKRLGFWEESGIKTMLRLLLLRIKRGHANPGKGDQYLMRMIYSPRRVLY
jgi:hypothetical protein